MSAKAVFARNHLEYLEEVCAISTRDPSRPIAFRSNRAWAGAKKALDEQGPLQAYIAPIDGHGVIRYRAVVIAVDLYPEDGKTETQGLLKLVLPGTADEGLWDGKVKTMYVLSHCRRLEEPFPMSRLLKARNSMPLSEKYAYSYAIVLELPEEIDAEMHPEEVSARDAYFEGAVRKATVNAYERDAAARAACIQHYGANCVVCDFSFEAKYGKMGAGFIHVHHLRPLHTIGKTYEVDPIKDLRPVCPNCHAMIHHPKAPDTIEELSALIRGRG